MTLYRAIIRYSGQAIRHLLTRTFATENKTRCGEAETTSSVVSVIETEDICFLAKKAEARE